MTLFFSPLVSVRAPKDRYVIPYYLISREQLLKATSLEVIFSLPTLEVPQVALDHVSLFISPPPFTQNRCLIASHPNQIKATSFSYPL